MTESDYIIQHLRMDLDKLKKENEDLKKENLTLTEQNTAFLESELKDEWNADEIYYCTRCGRPMSEPAWSDEINEYCDICAGDMGVI